MIFEDCYKCPEVSGLKDELEMDHNHNLRKDTRSLKVQTVSINDLLEEHNAPRDIDYMSIDTEGSNFVFLRLYDTLNLCLNTSLKLLLFPCNKNRFRISKENLFIALEWYESK